MDPHKPTRRRNSPQASAREEVADRLHSAMIHVLRRLRQSDKETGLSPARLSVLSVLTFAGSRTLGDLARIEQVRPPTMTQIVRALEKDRLVRRRPDPSDRRVTHIHATPRGRALLQRGRKRRLEVFTALLQHLTPADLNRLARSATLLEDIAREPDSHADRS